MASRGARRSALVVFALASGLAIAGCGSGDDLPDYTKATVCGISSKVVAEVLETPAFEITYDERPTMPFDGDPGKIPDPDAGHTSCTVSTGDSRLVLQGELIGSDELSYAQETATSLGHVFRHAGGLGGVRKGSSMWACGQVQLTALTRGVDPDDDALQTVLEEFADLAGCWPT